MTMDTNTARLLTEFLVDGFLRLPDKNKSSIRTGYKLYERNQLDNFITEPPPGYNFHQYAYSLMSSQAFAYNLMSGIDGIKFEVKFKTLKPYENQPAYPAQIDAMIVQDNTVRLYEVKAFELYAQAMDAIFKGERGDRYFEKECYFDPEFASEHFIPFLNAVKDKFCGRTIYASGVKQLCSHLLGIINCLDEERLLGKKVELYALCFDKMKGLGEFEGWLDGYKKDLECFGELANGLLEGYDKTRGKVKFCGYIGAWNFMNSTSIGNANYDYMKNRYYYK